MTAIVVISHHGVKQSAYRNTLCGTGEGRGENDLLEGGRKKVNISIEGKGEKAIGECAGRKTARQPIS